MKKEFEYPLPTDDPAIAEFKERLIDKELDNGIFDKLTRKPTGSFSKLAEVEKHLKREKKN